MTGKEALKIIREEAIESEYPEGYFIEELNIIEKDLELLDIFKKYLYINKNGQMYLKGLKEHSKDYETLKEWKNENS